MRRNQFRAFFAWQSVDQKECKNFIEECLRAALKKLVLPHTLAQLDRDTLGVSGTPDIVSTILQKIDESSAFIADVTLVGADERGAKTPNPNVMFELGYAVNSKGWDKVLLVINEAKAPWKDAPFDLGGTRRWPIRYSLRPEDDKPAVRAKLVEDLRLGLSAIYGSSLAEGLIDCGPAALSATHFLGMSRSGTDPIIIRTFQAELINVSDKPIKNISGFIQSDRSDKRFTLKLNRDGNLVCTTSLKVLPLHEGIGIGVPFTDTPASTGIPSSVFLEDITPFTLYLILDGVENVLRFTREDSEKLISNFGGTRKMNDQSGPQWVS